MKFMRYLLAATMISTLCSGSESTISSDDSWQQSLLREYRKLTPRDKKVWLQGLEYCEQEIEDAGRIKVLIAESLSEIPAKLTSQLLRMGENRSPIKFKISGAIELINAEKAEEESEPQTEEIPALFYN